MKIGIATSHEVSKAICQYVSMAIQQIDRSTFWKVPLWSKGFPSQRSWNILVFPVFKSLPTKYVVSFHGKKSACWGALDFLRRVTQLGGLCCNAWIRCSSIPKKSFLLLKRTWNLFLRFPRYDDVIPRSEVCIASCWSFTHWVSWVCCVCPGIDCLTLEDNIWTTMSTSKSATWCHCIFGSKMVHICCDFTLRADAPERLPDPKKGLKLHLVLSCKSWWCARILWIPRSSSERCGSLSISDDQICEFRLYILELWR